MEDFEEFMHVPEKLEKDVQSKVDWHAFRDVYFKQYGERWIPKRKVYSSEVKERLIAYLLEKHVLSFSPIGNYLIMRSGCLWGMYSIVAGGHLFFTDKETAREYASVFSFEHGSLDSGEPLILCAVQPQ